MMWGVWLSGGSNPPEWLNAYDGSVFASASRGHAVAHRDRVIADVVKQVGAARWREMEARAEFRADVAEFGEDGKPKEIA